MSSHRFHTFDTPIGTCGIAWSRAGIASVNLPETRRGEMHARLVRRFPGITEAAPPPAIRRAIAAIAGLLAGQESDLGSLDLDMADVPPFHRDVFEAARRIPAGQTVTYGELATQLGDKGRARAVGQALGRNPFALVIPCHRVLAAGGKLGGFSAHGGVATKKQLLEIEGARSAPAPSLFEGDGVFDFDVEAAIAHLRKRDRTMGRLIDRAGPFRMQLRRTPSLFVALAESIVYQQLNGRAAATIYARLCDLFARPQDGPEPDVLLRLSSEKLRSVGLSAAKALALQDLARKTTDGVIPSLREIQQLDNESIIERLITVRGIGRWTVEMLLMSRLGRPDVLPVDDFGVRNGCMLAYRLPAMPTRGELAERGERWKPYRSVASWYLWRAVDLAKKTPA